jgi:hypothetical protein
MGLLMTAAPALAQDWLDRVDDSLTFTNSDATLRARLSGLFDLEGYHFTQPAPGLIFANGQELLNPRLTLFCDVQLGSQLYFFAQARIDRGFDPSDSPLEARVDEYALRWTPWSDGRFNLQIGKFSSVVGNWSQRHLSWENPFINAPLIYENMTPIYDSELSESRGEFLEGLVDAKYEYNPVIWGSSYASGVAISGRWDKFDFALELKNAPLSSRPEVWGPDYVDLDHPTMSGRLGYRPNQAWNLGVSASRGAYLQDTVESELPQGHDMNDYQELVLGQDLSYAWHHWQFWAECYEARFQVPNVGHADTMGYYLEAKYKFTPQLFGALRWNQQLFDTVPDEAGTPTRWGHNTWRIDAATTYRFTPHTQIKLQYSLQHQSDMADAYGHLLAAQVTVRF